MSGSGPRREILAVFLPVANAKFCRAFINCFEPAGTPTERRVDERSYQPTRVARSLQGIFQVYNMMKSPVIFALATAATAATIGDYVPECAVSCLEDAIKSATPCAVDDLNCICIADNYRATYTAGGACVIQACGTDAAVGEYQPREMRSQNCPGLQLYVGPRL